MILLFLSSSCVPVPVLVTCMYSRVKVRVANRPLNQRPGCVVPSSSSWLSEWTSMRMLQRLAIYLSFFASFLYVFLLLETTCLIRGDHTNGKLLHLKKKIQFESSRDSPRMKNRKSSSISKKSPNSNTCRNKKVRCYRYNNCNHHYPFGWFSGIRFESGSRKTDSSQ